MAERRYLFNPGPTPVPPEVLAALAEPVVHHRERDYREVYERCLARLRDIYRTEHDVIVFTTSGTGAFESAVANLTSPGDRQLVLSAGNFGERWASMVKAFGADLVQALAAVAKEAGALVVVDAVSSLGAVPLETDAWGIDVVVSGSQKALMCPPGLAFASVSPAALETAASSTSPR